MAGRLTRALVAGSAAAAVAATANRRVAAGVRSSPAASSRWVRNNHAGVPVTLAEGPIAGLAALTGLAVDRALGGSGRNALAGAVVITGAGLVGAYDDMAGIGQAKGFRGHLAALRSGTVTSGMIKIAGVGLSAALAAVIIEPPRRLGSRLVDVGLDAMMIAGTANLTNLLDLRPGRAAKVIVALGAGLIGHGSAPVVGAAVGSLPDDLAGRSMLGDCGANALGAGLATAATGLPRWLRLMITAAVTALNLASERVSFTAVIERTPWLRRLDQLGRPRTAPPGGSGGVPPGSDTPQAGRG